MLDSLNLGILLMWSYLRGKRKRTKCVSRRTTDLARNGIFILTRKAHMHDAGYFRTRTPPQRIQHSHTILVVEGLGNLGPRKQGLVGIWTKISCRSPPLLPSPLARLLAAIIQPVTSKLLSLASPMPVDTREALQTRTMWTLFTISLSCHPFTYHTAPLCNGRGWDTRPPTTAGPTGSAQINGAAHYQLHGVYPFAGHKDDFLSPDVLV
jgi:hypothetical protein